jgi:Kef-type K+ transport system membrane component KefB
MVGFMLGGELTLETLRNYGKQVFGISLGIVVGVVAVMFAGLSLLGVPMPLAIMLAGIAPATDPAAVANVVHKLRARGRFTETLLGIVAIDDAWGLIAFSWQAPDSTWTPWPEGPGTWAAPSCWARPWPCPLAG